MYIGCTSRAAGKAAGALYGTGYFYGDHGAVWRRGSALYGGLLAGSKSCDGLFVEGELFQHKGFLFHGMWIEVVNPKCTTRHRPLLLRKWKGGNILSACRGEYYSICMG